MKAPTTPLFEIEGLRKAFGGLVVADDIALRLGAGDRVALIGPNGAGKTTFVNLVTGALSPSAGRVRLSGRDITHATDVERVRLGLVRTFQVSRLFRDMTMREHVWLAIRQRDGEVGLFSRGRPAAAVAEEADTLLEPLGLLPEADQLARAVAYGHQRLLELAIAMALKPKVLLLDEPAAGVPHAEVARIVGAIDRLPAELGVLMIEHDMDLVFRFARRVVVLASGGVICEGTPAEVAADARVRAVYLGSYAHDRR